MPNAPLVSVVMPAYNVDKYIAESISSILNQTYSNFELIILDDASTDGTWQIIKGFAKKDKRIVTLRNKENLYIAGNRNKGISVAKGKYIVWQDADDIAVSTRLEKLVELMESSPEVGICGSYLQSFSGDRKLDIRPYATTDKELRRDIFKFSPVAQPTAIIRKECFDLIGGYDLAYPPAEDLDMSFRIGTKYKFANVSEVLLYYREHPNSATFVKMKKQIKTTLDIRKKYAKTKFYNMRSSDRLANLVTQLITFFPPKVVIFIFKILRSFLKTKLGIILKV